MAASGERRVKRELKTVGAMIRLYCRQHHGRRPDLCADCRELWDYAQKRVTHCPLLEDKPTCGNCPVHCYKPAMRERIKAVMRYSGPRMLWRYPRLAVLHLVDSRRDHRRKTVRARTAARPKNT